MGSWLTGTGRATAESARAVRLNRGPAQTLCHRAVGEISRFRGVRRVQIFGAGCVWCTKRKTLRPA
jgi:hypothetical protein